MSFGDFLANEFRTARLRVTRVFLFLWYVYGLALCGLAAYGGYAYARGSIGRTLLVGLVGFALEFLPLLVLWRRSREGRR